ncbi:MAG TPA: hypothetical protein VJ824_04330 [Bacillota bacterium]|nr:hypothetical protein [Bacillota bacterium]
MEMTEKSRKILGMIGCIVLAIGVFCPLVRIPYLGEVNYFNNGKGGGVFVLILAVISFIIILAGKYKPLIYTGIISLCVMGFTYFYLQFVFHKITAKLSNQFGEKSKSLADMIVQSVHLEIGWIVLTIGAVLLIVAGAAKVKQAHNYYQ